MSCACNETYTCLNCENTAMWLKLKTQTRVKLLALQKIVMQENHTAEDLKQFAELENLASMLDLTVANIPAGATIYGVKKFTHRAELIQAKILDAERLS